LVLCVVSFALWWAVTGGKARGEGSTWTHGHRATHVKERGGSTGRDTKEECRETKAKSFIALPHGRLVVHLGWLDELLGEANNATGEPSASMTSGERVLMATWE
jgi:hypothetical protein